MRELLKLVMGAGLVLALPVALVGCEAENGEPMPEQVEETAEEAADETEEAVEEAGDAVEDATDDA
jgi:hypothetical protein